MLKSPDDIGVWGILKRRLQKRKINTITRLKKALKDNWNKLDQRFINNTLES